MSQFVQFAKKKKNEIKHLYQFVRSVSNSMIRKSNYHPSPHMNNLTWLGGVTTLLIGWRRHHTLILKRHSKLICFPRRNFSHQFKNVCRLKHHSQRKEMLTQCETFNYHVHCIAQYPYGARKGCRNFQSVKLKPYKQLNFSGKQNKLGNVIQLNSTFSFTAVFKGPVGFALDTQAQHVHILHENKFARTHEFICCVLSVFNRWLITTSLPTQSFTTSMAYLRLDKLQTCLPGLGAFIPEGMRQVFRELKNITH